MTIYAIEELQGFDGLEIEELVTKEQKTAKSGEYAELKDYVDNVVGAQNAAADEAESGDLGGDVAEGEASADDANDAPSDDPEGTGDASDGGGSLSEQSDDKADESSAEKKDGADKKEGETDEEDPLTEKDGKKTTAVAESLRQEHYERLILEALETSDITAALGSMARGAGRLVGHGVMAVGQFGLETLGRLAGVLRDLGIEYSPVVAKAIKLGVIYLYTKSVKSLFKLIVGVSDWAKRYYRNIDKRQKEIHDLRAALEKLKSLNEPVSLEGKRFVTTDVLSWLTTEHAVSPMNSAGVVSRFFTTAVSEIDRAMQYDVSLVKKLIELSETGVRGELTGYLKVQPFSGAFLRRNVKGYVKDPELVESFVYREALPDSVLFVATLPRRELKDMEAIGHAYQASGIFLAVDDRARPAADGIDYMDIEALAKYLNVLEGLCESAKTHKAFFARIIKDAEALKFGYKHYYQKMVESEEQATIRSSLVEYVYHKQSFTTKVYAPAAMDVHDYVTAYLLRALRFAKANVKALSP